MHDRILCRTQRRGRVGSPFVRPRLWAQGSMRGRPWFRSIAPFLLAPVILSGCGAPTGPAVETALSDPGIHAWASQAAILIDAHRVSLGCAPLRWHRPGAVVAEDYARQMSEQDFFGHVDPDGVTLKQRLNRAGISGYRLAAETIAAGQDNPPKVVADWVASPAHRAILEDCRYGQVGLGFHAGNGSYREYWTAVFFAI